MLWNIFIENCIHFVGIMILGFGLVCGCICGRYAAKRNKKGHLPKEGVEDLEAQDEDEGEPGLLMLPPPEDI